MGALTHSNPSHNQRGLQPAHYKLSRILQPLAAATIDYVSLSHPFLVDRDPSRKLSLVVSYNVQEEATGLLIPGL